MKKTVVAAALMLCSLNVFSQNTRDSISAIIKTFQMSLEIGYNFLFPSATELDTYYSPGSTEVQNIFDSRYRVAFPWSDTSCAFFHHNQWFIAIAAESNVV